jgi:hypothetical protein
LLTNPLFSLSLSLSLCKGDDVFMVVENLRKFLLQSAAVVEASRSGSGVYLGHRLLNPDTPFIFNAGGPGYVLDRAAVSKLVNTCVRPHTHTY